MNIPEKHNKNLEHNEESTFGSGGESNGVDEHSENLGLDADRSSDDQRIDRKYNMDNDMISHNPKGEEDDSDWNIERGSSPLMDK